MRLTERSFLSTRVRSKQVVDCRPKGEMTEVTLRDGRVFVVYESFEYIMALVNKYRRSVRVV